MANEDQLHKILTETTNLKTYWSERNDKLQSVREIINLVRPQAVQDASNWISNEPKVFFDTSRALISINEPRFRLPIPMNYSPEEKQKMNKAERLIIGVARSLNHRTMDRGGVSWLWDLAYWVLQGWYSVFAVVRKHPITGEVEFVGDIYDPMTVYPQWDSNDLTKCVRAYQVDKITAMAMAENLLKQLKSIDKFTEPTEEANIDVINYWTKIYNNGKPRVYNAIVINGQLIKKITLQPNLKHIPIHIGAIGSPDVLFDNWMKRKGESIIDADTDMYLYTNHMIRLLAEIMEETAYPNLVSATRTGQGVLRGKPLKGHGQEISVKLGDTVELLKHAAAPQEVQALLDYFREQTQKGSIPNVVYGGVNVELSGFAISQLMAAIKYKLSPYLNALQAIISRVMTDFLVQYKEGNYPAITLSTADPHGRERGVSYIEEYSPDDVPERTFVEVTIPITSQYDKTQAILNGVQALQSGLVSRETLWDTVPELEVPDSEQEKERIKDDMVSQDPFVIDIEIVQGLWRLIDKYELNPETHPHAEALKRYVMQKEMALGMRQGIPTKPNAPGIPPNQMPPEARNNPDEKRTMLGQPPPSPTRPTGGV